MIQKKFRPTLIKSKIIVFTYQSIYIIIIKKMITKLHAIYLHFENILCLHFENIGSDKHLIIDVKVICKKLPKTFIGAIE